MGIAYPPHNKQNSLDELPLPGDESTDDVLSLLEENARLRGLVVKLSNLILRNVADRRERHVASKALGNHRRFEAAVIQRGPGRVG
jgi:hypothetical protein